MVAKPHTKRGSRQVSANASPWLNPKDTTPAWLVIRLILQTSKGL